MKIFIIILVALVTLSVVAVEETEGMRAMRLGCEKQNLGLGCTNYANFLIKNGRESEADAYFDKGCKLGNQDGCDKKKWPVKEVVSPAPEVVIESPIEETPEETPVPVVPEAEIPATPTPADVVPAEPEIPATPTPADVVPAETETPPSPTEELPPTEESVPSPAE